MNIPKVQQGPLIEEQKRVEARMHSENSRVEKAKEDTRQAAKELQAKSADPFVGKSMDLKV